MSSSDRAWTRKDLLALRAMGVQGWSSPAIGQALGRMAAEVDRASWALLGRDEDAALAVLNAGLPTTLPGRLREFVARTLGA